MKYKDFSLLIRKVQEPDYLHAGAFLSDADVLGNQRDATRGVASVRLPRVAARSCRAPKANCGSFRCTPATLCLERERGITSPVAQESVIISSESCAHRPSRHSSRSSLRTKSIRDRCRTSHSHWLSFCPLCIQRIICVSQKIARYRLHRLQMLQEEFPFRRT